MAFCQQFIVSYHGNTETKLQHDVEKLMDWNKGRRLDNASNKLLFLDFLF